MSSQKYTLEGVSQTLLIPLAARASANKYGVSLDDSMAQEMVRVLNLNSEEFLFDKATIMGCLVRSYLLDQLALNFFHSNGRGSLVNLGAGLCTRYFRLALPYLTGFDIDFEPVVELKKNLLDGAQNYHFIPSSILDFEWIKGIKQSAPEPYFFILEGVSMYLKKDQIEVLIDTLANNFPGAQIHFDYCHPLVTQFTPLSSRTVSKMNVSFEWGTSNLKQFIKGRPGSRLISDLSLTREISKHYGPLGVFARLPGISKAYRLGGVEFT